MANVSVYLQYGASHNLRTLFDQIAKYATIDFDEWYKKYFDLRYCDHDGLSWWGAYLNQQKYITVDSLYKNITTNQMEQSFFDTYQTPSNFNNGNWYNGQTVLRYFSDEEFRLILMNAWLKTYWACTLGNLADFLSNFFKRLPDMPFKDTNWRITTVTRPDLPEFWWIEYSPAFIGDGGKWKALFEQKKPNGDSVIMPIPNDVQWGLRLLEE